MRLFVLPLIIILLAGGLGLTGAQRCGEAAGRPGPGAALAQDSTGIASVGGDGKQPAVARIEAVNAVTWWYHSAIGYHPAILVVIRNSSGQDLSGVPIRFQARFTNLRDGYVTVAREEIGRGTDLSNVNGKIQMLLKGPRAFELPIDPELWPHMECKIMCRVGDVEDEATQTILVTKIAAITMSEEDAKDKLAKQLDFTIRRARPKPSNPDAVLEKPLVAMAGSINEKPKAKVSLLQFLNSSYMPGLGDDFYTFEKKFGIPVEYDAHSKDWTWARYQNTSPDFSVIVGSRGQTGKADLIVATVPPSQIKGEQQVSELARAISGKFHSETVGPPNHSVRYLPTGRLEFGTLSAKNYRAVYFVPGESGLGTNTFVVVVTRIPGNVLNVLRQEAPKAKLLKFLSPVTGLAEET